MKHSNITLEHSDVRFLELSLGLTDVDLLWLWDAMRFNKTHVSTQYVLLVGRVTMLLWHTINIWQQVQHNVLLVYCISQDVTPKSSSVSVSGLIFFLGIPPLNRKRCMVTWPCHKIVYDWLVVGVRKPQMFPDSKVDLVGFFQYVIQAFFCMGKWLVGGLVMFYTMARKHPAMNMLKDKYIGSNHLMKTQDMKSSVLWSKLWLLVD